jgi:hypothetical protein
MCTREMTLGEEIINLTKRGIDVPTVERMYRKYINLDEKGKSEGCYAIDLGPLFPTFDIGDTVRYCRADVEATLNLFRDTVHNPYSILPADIKVGDKMMVPLGVARTAITVVVTIPAIPTPVRISGLCFTVAVFTLLQILVKLGFCISVYPP